VGRPPHRGRFSPDLVSDVSKFFGRLFGTQKAIDDLTDKDNGLLVRAGGWVNGLSYTDQEKAEASQEVREWGLRQLEALAPFKVVQRILAFGVTAVWAFVAMNVVAAVWVDAVWDLGATRAMLEFALSDYVFWPVLAVLSLYFTGGVLPGVFNAGKAQKK
jgi:hypothetical protein